jgi:hypothetical protein
MGIEIKSKLNYLLSNWPDGQIKTSKWLKEHGYGAEYLQKYKRGQWIQPLGAGGYRKFGDKVDWTSALACLQQDLKLQIHVGGKSALELLGKAQYLQLNQKKVLTVGNEKYNLPLWLNTYPWDIKIEHRIKKLFLNDSFKDKRFGLTVIEIGRHKIIMSASERAYLEYLDDVPKRGSYREAVDLLENLPTLRSSVMQNLLENCKSIKVKRLFLHMSEKVNHPWFKKLNLKNIHLGAGKRAIFKDGILDKKYNITIPADDSYVETEV